MKKLFAFMVAFSLIFSMTSGYAQTYTRSALGMSFALPDNWNLSAENESSLLFAHNSDPNEVILIETIAIDGAYDIDFLSENSWKNVCLEWYANERLAARLNEANDTNDVSIKTEFERSDYVTIGGTKYYHYEKAYTASVYGFYDQSFYNIVFITAKNGNIYSFEYSRTNDLAVNHYADVATMLENISYAEGEIKIIIDGERIIPDTPPMIVSGRTLVPIRAVAEKMGYDVGWDADTQTVTIVGKHNLVFTIDSQTAVKNSEEITLDVPAILFNARTYLPLRAVVEAMDAQVQWSEEEKTIYITSSKE